MPQATQLGRYQLLDRIAFGGMAEIYRAKTFDSEGRVRMVAVKRVLQHLTTDEDFLRMLVDEAKLTAILDHPAIARVYEFSQAGDEYFIAMEFVDGRDVRAVLEKHRQAKTHIPPEHVAWIIAHVADGLHAAHIQQDADGRALQIVHRDVSPSNILCSYQGDPKLCDFGIAKATMTRVQTRTGVIKGKVKYMSPEQAMGRKLDGRSDLFSLGSVMYELLTLEPPFIAQTEVELIFAVRDAKKRSASELRPDLPQPLVDIVDRVMQRQRTDRFQTGRELSRELHGYLERNHPAYKRATLGRYLRTLFKEEIERDLRQLESWVIETSDASCVGVNLIADALPDDAVWKTFSPASVSVDLSQADLEPQKTSIYSREQYGDLHAQATRIGPQPGRPRTRAELHTAATMMLEGSAADALHAQLREAGLHEQATRLLENPAVRTAPAPQRSESPSSLPEQPTRLAKEPSRKKIIAPTRPPHDTAPDSAPMRFDECSNERTVPRKRRSAELDAPKVITEFSSEDSQSNVTNPLADLDLEEL